MSNRTEEEQREHDAVIAYICEHSLLSKDNRKHFANPGDAQNRGVSFIHPNGRKFAIFPDIVVTEDDESHVVLCAEVATASDMNESSVPKWESFRAVTEPPVSYAGSCRFILYVPKECVHQAMELTPDGFELWSYEPLPDGRFKLERVGG